MFDVQVTPGAALTAVFTTILGLVSIVVVRALTSSRRKYLFSTSELSSADLGPEALEGSEQRLARGLTFPTITISRDTPPPREELLRYHQHLRESFPTVFNSDAVKVEAINELSLLFTVSGTEPSLSPYLLLSHMDVVPVVEKNWSRPPFGGLIEDGYIIGRGAIDVKQTGHAILECLEHRLKTGDLPRRPLIVAFGHDEEINGANGAKKLAEVLMMRKVKPLFCLDEGTMILDKFFPGIKHPVAVVGVCEKGYLALELSATGTAGHSSIPPLDMAVGRLARAVARLHPNPQPVLFNRGPERELLHIAGQVATPLFRLVYRNVWLFGLLLKMAFLKIPALRASITTTTAVTVVEGGYKENVVPAHARAVVNHRISPLMNKDEVIENDIRAIDDPAIKIKVLHHTPPSPISPYSETDAPFNMLAGVVHQLYGEQSITAPAVLVANTDTRYYLDLTKHVFRFNPILTKPHELSRFHGDNEMIGVENYHNCIRFYYRLMKNMEVETAISHMP